MALRTIAAGDVNIADGLPFGHRELSFTHAHTVSMHSHGFYEIGITRGGSAEHIAAGRTETISRGSIYILAPGEAHAVRVRRQWEVCNIYYLPDIFAAELTSFLAEPRMAGLFFYHFLFDANDVISFPIPDARFRSLTALIDALPALSSHFYRKHIFAAICALIADAHAAVFPAERMFSADKRIVSVLSAVERHIGKDSAAIIRAAAEDASIRREYLSTLFHRVTGTALTDYIMRRKIMKSRAMILAGERVTDTALSLGFYDTPHFTRTFKTMTGLSPRDYQKHARSTAHTASRGA
ncbi:MAG: AraC family transcriptional regulator [Spirochaetota bacterium]